MFVRKFKPTSVQSLSRETAVSVGLMLMVFSSIKLLSELPPGGQPQLNQVTHKRLDYDWPEKASCFFTWHHHQWRHVAAVSWIYNHFQSVDQDIWEKLQPDPVLLKTSKTKHRFFFSSNLQPSVSNLSLICDQANEHSKPFKRMGSIIYFILF